MMVNNIMIVYFTGTGTTKKVVEAIGEAIYTTLYNGRKNEKGFDGISDSKISLNCVDFSLPDKRKKTLVFDEKTLVVMGMPVVAGRMPNLIKKEIKIVGNGALAIPVVLYGNRDFQDSLIELKDLMEDSGCKPIGAAAFIGEHSFSTVLAKGRPDDLDIEEATKFGCDIGKRVLYKEEPFSKWEEVGNPKPYFGYYKPMKEDGTFIDIRHVKPVTNEDCILCMKCVLGCRMGAIEKNNPNLVSGTCMKCCYCIKNCPVSAKEFNDESFVYHKEDLESKYLRKKNNKIFI